MGLCSTFKFHDKATVPAIGKVMYLADMGSDCAKTMTLHIFGTATSKAVSFYTYNINGDLVPLNGFNVSNCSLTTSIPSTNPITEIWALDVEGLIHGICIQITAISGGNLTVIGEVFN